MVVLSIKRFPKCNPSRQKGDWVMERKDESRTAIRVDLSRGTNLPLTDDQWRYIEELMDWERKSRNMQYMIS